MAWGNDNGKGNNPWGSVPPSGGGPRGQRPPEFDDIFGNFQKRMNALLPKFLRGRGLTTILLVIVLFLWATSGFFRVQPAEEGVVLRFGEWVRTEPQGLHYHLPYPIEQVIVLDVSNVNRIDIGRRSEEARRQGIGQTALLNESLMLTGDENIVNTSFTVFWVIEDAKDYLFNIQPPQSGTVKEVAESVMREIIGKSEFQNAITGERGSIQDQVVIRLQEVLNDYGAGILITGVELAKVESPPQVLDAFRDVQAAQQDSKRYEQEAEAYANEVVPISRGNASIILNQAAAYKEEVIARSIGEASRFLAVYEEYAKAKEVTRKRIYLETMEEILNGMNKIIIDEGAGTGVVPYLPLPELRARQKSGEGDSK